MIFAQTVGLSIAFSIGLASYLGFFYTPLHTVRTVDMEKWVTYSEREGEDARGKTSERAP